MDEDALQGIYNYHRLTDLIATAGPPSEEELAAVAHAGFQVVVNLALRDAEYSLPEEGHTVESLGLSYVYIPVVWESPLRSDLERFFEAMDKLAGRKLFIHCAANKRVSVFMALYRQLRQAWPPDATMPDVLAIWEPDAVWQPFMEPMTQAMTSGRNRA